MRNAHLIIFDWDGTLFRSVDLIEQSIVAAGREVGREIPAAVARDVIGLGLKASQERLFPGETDLSPVFLAKFHRAYRAHYEQGEAGVELYAGAFDLVRDLNAAGKTIAVATAKSRGGIDRCLATTGLAAYISHSRTPEECRPKPDPQMILELMAATGIGAAETLMVGDTSHDLKMAANAGVKAVGLTHGAHAEAELQSASPLKIVAGIAALRAELL
ncbi:MAG: HAD-IA family hydrolase [Turneriella sp.]|nr:HAD-IA family hydrolase [Turneriella sp.]